MCGIVSKLKYSPYDTVSFGYLYIHLSRFSKLFARKPYILVNRIVKKKKKMHPIFYFVWHDHYFLVFAYLFIITFFLMDSYILMYVYISCSLSYKSVRCRWRIEEQFVSDLKKLIIIYEIEPIPLKTNTFKFTKIWHFLRLNKLEILIFSFEKRFDEIKKFTRFVLRT